MKRVTAYLVLFFLFSHTIAAFSAISSEKALENLIFNHLYFDFNGHFSQTPQPWRIDTFEDVEKIPMKLFLSGAKVVSYSSFAAHVSKSHLTESQLNSLKKKYSSNQIIYIFKDPGDGSFIEICDGIHSKPPAMPADFSGSQSDWNSLYNWPCSGCGRVGHSHSDTAFCMYSYMGIERAGAEYKLEPTSDHPGMQVYSVHLGSGSDWWYTTGSEWQNLVESSKSSFNCHRCVCDGDSYTRTYHRSDGSTYTRTYCCHNRSNTRVEYLVSFSPTSIMHSGKSWDANKEIVASNYIANGGQIHWLDRTPPEIRDFTTYTQSTDGYLPTADATDGVSVIRNTTGDFRRLSLKFYDENIWANSIACNIALAPASWTFDAKNSSDGKFRFSKFANETYVSKSGRGLAPNPIQLPSHFHGTMEYSIYAWDGSNNLNPSDSFVADNEPWNCYGVCAPGSGKRHNYKYGDDLLTDPPTAKPFPFMAPGDLPPTDRAVESPYLPQETGYIRLYDNDRPNIMISVVNLKDKQKAKSDSSLKYNICFPPPEKAVPSWMWNKSEFQDFTAGLLFDYQEFIATDSVYFMPIEIRMGETGGDSENRSAIFAGSDNTVKGLVTSGADQKNSFFRKLFSLEDYGESDTVKTTGKLNQDVSNADSLRKRLGFGESLDVFNVFPLEEDVEYEIRVWTQDNSRYVANEGGRMPEAVVDSYNSTPGSGIKELKISCKNGSSTEFEPTISSTEAWNSCLHGPYKIVFRDPSSKLFDGSSVPDLISLSNNNPSITVIAKDVAGNSRTLRLFFQIRDQKARIRTLEQRHMR